MTEALVGSETAPEVADAEPQVDTEAAPAEATAEAEDDAPKQETFTFEPAADGDERVYPPALIDEFPSEEKFREWLKAPITVIAAKHLIPKGSERWFFNKLRDKQGLDQPRFWLEQARVPALLQERIMLLSDEDFTRFYTDWQKESFGAGPGE